MFNLLALIVYELLFSFNHWCFLLSELNQNLHLRTSYDPCSHQIQDPYCLHRRCLPRSGLARPEEWQRLDLVRMRGHLNWCDLRAIQLGCFGFQHWLSRHFLHKADLLGYSQHSPHHLLHRRQIHLEHCDLDCTSLFDQKSKPSLFTLLLPWLSAALLTLLSFEVQALFGSFPCTCIKSESLQLGIFCIFKWESTEFVLSQHRFRIWFARFHLDQHWLQLGLL